MLLLSPPRTFYFSSASGTVYLPRPLLSLPEILDPNSEVDPCRSRRQQTNDPIVVLPTFSQSLTARKNFICEKCQVRSLIPSSNEPLRLSFSFYEYHAHTSTTKMTTNGRVTRTTTTAIFVYWLLASFRAGSSCLAFLSADTRRPALQRSKLHVISPNVSNEWGIPYSSDLPPLVRVTTRPIPQCLSNGGRVTLVGSGPGDPDLLTVSAYKLLTQADKENTIVIADRLVSPEILNLITCDVKVARKLPGCAELAQEEIYWWAYQALNQGKHVIRLKIGDPFVFGRGGEEVLTCRRFGVEPVVIPVRSTVLIDYVFFVCASRL